MCKACRSKVRYRRERAIEYAGQILSALDAAHCKGIIHRDLKPSNILVTKQHGIKLLDFGLARMLSASADATLTQPGDRLGTPAYMAPSNGKANRETRARIFTVSGTCLRNVDGQTSCAGRAARWNRHNSTALYGTCLEQSPDDRWQSARDIWRTMTLPAPPTRKPGRTSWWVAAVAL